MDCSQERPKETRKGLFLFSDCDKVWILFCCGIYLEFVA